MIKGWFMIKKIKGIALIVFMTAASLHAEHNDGARGAQEAVALKHMNDLDVKRWHWLYRNTQRLATISSYSSSFGKDVVKGGAEIGGICGSPCVLLGIPIAICGMIGEFSWGAFASFALERRNMIAAEKESEYKEQKRALQLQRLNDPNIKPEEINKQL